LEIYNTSGGLVRKLTNNGGGPNPVINYNPSWGPDGRIAFASNSSGQFQIYTINADGSNLTPVTTNGGDWPTWAPDSSRIAFESTRGGNSEIYSVALSGNALGNGLDLSQVIGNQTAQDKFWMRAKNMGIDFAVVAAWGGGPRYYQQVEANLLGAQRNGVATAAYALLNYFEDETGSYQVGKAIEAAGSAKGQLKFMAVDVEYCCGEFVEWQRSYPYQQYDSITDASNHIQTVVSKGGISGNTEPVWNDSGGVTQDGTVTWQDEHVFVADPIGRVQRISDAVAAITANNLKPVIYTTRRFWKGFADNCNANPKNSNNCSNLIALPLWDAEPGCGDGIIGLTPFTEFPATYGWDSRSGNQYHYLASGCQGVAIGNVSVDLDYFDPKLFQ
jgi:hypothetical protein